MYLRSGMDEVIKCDSPTPIAILHSALVSTFVSTSVSGSPSSVSADTIGSVEAAEVSEVVCQREAPNYTVATDGAVI